MSRLVKNLESRRSLLWFSSIMFVIPEMLQKINTGEHLDINKVLTHENAEFKMFCSHGKANKMRCV